MSDRRKPWSAPRGEPVRRTVEGANGARYILKAPSSCIDTGEGIVVDVNFEATKLERRARLDHRVVIVNNDKM